jgi:hypothetical protein
MSENNNPPKKKFYLPEGKPLGKAFIQRESPQESL